VCTTRSLRTVRPWSLGGVSAVAEEDGRVASRHRTVVTLKGWGPMVWRMDRDGERNEKSLRYKHSKLAIATRRILAKASSDPGYFLARFRGFEEYEHGSWTDKRWMNSQRWLFENLGCSRNFTSISYLIGKELMLKGRRVGGKEPSRHRFKTDFHEERKACNKVP
jgi:hypothetical protein